MIKLENKLEEKICIVCGKSFTPTTKSQKICSDKCRKIRHSQESKAYYRQHKTQRVFKKRICKFCGKEFSPTCHNRAYCSELCAKKAKQQQQFNYYKSTVKRDSKPNGKMSLCWSCENACGDCSWSRSLTPVKGWTAKEVVRETNTGNLPSYKVIECPQYEAGR